MSDLGVEAIAPAPEAETNPTQPASDAGFSLPNDDSGDDKALDAIWDKANGESSSEKNRDDATGRFVSQEAENPAVEDPTPVEGEGEAADVAPETSTPEATDVPLPSSWRGLEATWGEIPVELRGVIAGHEAKLHSTLSEQGKQLSEYKPVNDVIEKYATDFQSVKLGDGSTPTAAQTIDYLFSMNKAMEINPVETILQFADSFKVREQVAAKLGEVSAPPEGGENSVLLEEIAGLKRDLQSSLQSMQDPARINDQISVRLQEDQQLRDASDLISRFKADKPLYDEIPEKHMDNFIELTMQTLGEHASAEEVLAGAYDMGINAIPALRAKIAAEIPAAKTDPKKVADAKRANGVNVTSTSSGKTRQLTDDEELGAAYDNAQRS